MQAYRILFAEDDFLSMAIIGEHLSDNGYSVQAVDCGSAAFEAIDRAGEFSALLTDIDLGPGPNGFDVARYARVAYPGLPVVYISGGGPARHAVEGVGGSEFIAKPSTPEHVLETLSRVIHREAA